MSFLSSPVTGSGREQRAQSFDRPICRRAGCDRPPSKENGQALTFGLSADGLREAVADAVEHDHDCAGPRRDAFLDIARLPSAPMEDTSHTMQACEAPDGGDGVTPDDQERPEVLLSISHDTALWHSRHHREPANSAAIWS